MSRLPMGTYCPGDSILYRLDARAKLLCFVALLAAIICTKALIGYITLCAITGAIILVSGTRLSDALGLFGRLWLFLLIIFLMNALFFNANDPILQWWIFTLSTEGVLQGVRVVANVSLVLLLSNVFMCVTRPVEITNALADLLYPLSFVGVPVQDVAMIITVAIRFVPTLLEETDMIRLAQTARGARFDTKRLTEKAKSMLQMVIPVFISAFKRADDLAQAMEARGYRGMKGRTVYHRRPLCRADCVAALLCMLVCTAQIVLFC